MSDAVESPESGPPLHLLGDKLLARIAGAAPVSGNAVRLLRNAAENYPAWLEAIAAAGHVVYFENYIFSDDSAGRPIAAALMERARAGVAVFVLYDWLGCLTKASRALWRDMAAAGVQLRCFNPPRLASPFGWISRNHRKTLSVDGAVGFVSGLCVGKEWVGDAEAGIAPWRDTGVELRGPAVADLQLAFAQTWGAAGPALPPPPVLPERPEAGGVAVNVIASEPNAMVVYRLDQVVAVEAQRSLWLTDAYFVGTTAYVRSLIDAARDGVDVRLLVPGASDVPVAKALSRAGYRALLEAGIRVFEWNGSMLHAKTAVADGSWVRIGSSNLNLASWLGNWELDVAIEDADLADQMEEMFLEDQAQATEMVLDLGKVRGAEAPWRETRRKRRGSPGRAAAGALSIGSAVGAAITNRRTLGPAEARILAAAGAIVTVLAVVAILAPHVLTIPFSLIGLWIAVTLFVRAWQLRRRRP